MLNEIRLIIRSLLKQPGFTSIAVATVALGVGVNVAIFSVVYGLLLRPLPYRDPDRLVWVTNMVQSFRAEMVSGADYLDWRDHSRSLEQVAAWDVTVGLLTARDGQPVRAIGARVSPTFLPALGATPRAGRGFDKGDAKQGAAPVVILSDGLWRRLFGDDVALESQAVRMGSQLLTVVGVLPKGFQFPQQPNVEMLVPLVLDEGRERGRQQMTILSTLARLAPGVTADQAREELKTIRREGEQRAHEQREAAGPMTMPLPGGPMGGGGNQVEVFDDAVAPPGGPDGPADGPGPRAGPPESVVAVVPLQRHLVGDVRPLVLALMASAAFVLLIACANLANLMLARSTSRLRELSIRAAIGASRGRIISLVILESVITAAIGTVAGVVLAAWVVQALVTLAPVSLGAGIFQQMPLGLDVPVLIFAAAIALAVGVLFGVGPALLVSRADVTTMLRASGGGHSSARPRARFRAVLVATEVAVAVVLLVGATLLVRSFARVLDVDPGFHAERVVTVALDPASERYQTPDSLRTFYAQIEDRVGAIAGVEAVGIGDTVPLRDYSMVMMGLQVEGTAPSREAEPEVAVTMVTPGYFTTMGMQLRRGRVFTDADRPGAPPVILVNETMARHYWGSLDPVGRRLRIGPRRPDWLTVVGVVADTRHDGLEASSRAAMYRPLAQEPVPFSYVAVRSALEPTAVIGALRQAVRQVDPSLVVYDVASMSERLSRAMAPRRFSMALVSAFAFLALLLSAIGVYGVLAYVVGERTREFGIRRALGATGGDVIGLVARQAGAMVAAGLAVGLAVAFAASPLLGSALFATAPRDRWSFVLVPVLIVLSAVAAMAAPARRAVKVDPAVTLKVEG